MHFLREGSRRYMFDPSTFVIGTEMLKLLKDKGDLSLYASFSFKRYLCSSVCIRWINNWNKRDVDSVVSRYSHDCVFESPIAAKIFGRSMTRGSDPILLKPATKAPGRD
jgi:hypothetical protein